jgi:hypothetical protein
MTSTQTAHLRLALFGRPGAGKSSTAGFIEAYCRAAPLGFYRLRLAEPLYRCQEFIYSTASRQLEAGVQDGALLNFLGSHLRRINPNVLLDDFRSRLEGLPAREAGIVLCDDMRAADAAEMKAMGFCFIHINAPNELRRERRAQRGDATPGDEDHPTERGLDGIRADYEIENDGSREALRARAEEVVRTHLGLAR